MTPIFADAFYFFAILNRKDPEHERAIEFSRAHTGPILTTAWVLTEVAAIISSRRDSEFCWDSRARKPISSR